MEDTQLDLIGSSEAGAILNVDRSTFLRWAKAGKIAPAVTGNGKTGGEGLHAHRRRGARRQP